MRKIVALLVLVALIAGLTACGPAAAPDAIQQSIAPEETKEQTGVFPGTPESDMVTLDLTSEPMSLNSMVTNDRSSITVLQHVMAGLMRLDENNEPVADVAESWEISEDKTVYTIKLRQDMKWSNGDAVTANDFYYAWLWQLDPANAGQSAYFLYENIKGGQEYYEGKADATQLGLKVLDDYTLQIEWNRPMPDGLFHLALSAYMPMNQKAFEQIGAGQYALDADKIVTNGPYNLVEWTHDDSILLEKNEEYFDAQRIKIPKVKLVMIDDSNARLNAFMAGELDQTNLYDDQIKQVENLSKNSLYRYFDGVSYYFSFNMQNENLKNTNLRKALAYSVDIQSLLDHVIADGSERADGLVPRTIAGVDGNSYADARGSLFDYDLEAAKGYLGQALTELGKTAEELKLTLSVYDSAYSQTQAAYIQQQWKDNLGLDVEIEVLPVKALYEAKGAGDYEIGIEIFGADIDDPIAYLQGFLTDNPNNYGRYSNPQYEQLIRDANTEGDAKKRQDMMIEAERILIEDMALGPMYFTCTTYAVSDKLKGLVRSPFQVLSVTNGASIAQ